MKTYYMKIFYSLAPFFSYCLLENSYMLHVYIYIKQTLLCKFSYLQYFVNNFLYNRTSYILLYFALFFFDFSVKFIIYPIIYITFDTLTRHPLNLITH